MFDVVQIQAPVQELHLNNCEKCDWNQEPSDQRISQQDSLSL